MRQISDVLQPRADISGASSNLDGWGFVLGPQEAAAHRAWSRTRLREVARNAKQHERWSKLLQDTSELESDAEKLCETPGALEGRRC